MVYRRTEEGVNVLSDIELLVMCVTVEGEDPTTHNSERQKRV
jgi:hypothetical protein